MNTVATNLVEFLKARGLTCATAESCTGGGWHCEKRITVFDDPEAGILRTPLGEVRYDPATGRRIGGK